MPGIDARGGEFAAALGGPEQIDGIAGQVAALDENRARAHAGKRAGGAAHIFQAANVDAGERHRFRHIRGQQERPRDEAADQRGFRLFGRPAADRAY